MDEIKDKIDTLMIKDDYMIERSIFSELYTRLIPMLDMLYVHGVKKYKIGRSIVDTGNKHLKGKHIIDVILNDNTVIKFSGSIAVDKQNNEFPIGTWKTGRSTFQFHEGKLHGSCEVYNDFEWYVCSFWAGSKHGKAVYYDQDTCFAKSIHIYHRGVIRTMIFIVGEIGYETSECFTDDETVIHYWFKEFYVGTCRFYNLDRTHIKDAVIFDRPIKNLSEFFSDEIENITPEFVISFLNDHIRKIVDQLPDDQVLVNIDHFVSPKKSYEKPMTQYKKSKLSIVE